MKGADSGCCSSSGCSILCEAGDSFAAVDDEYSDDCCNLCVVVVVEVVGIVDIVDVEMMSNR